MNHDTSFNVGGALVVGAGLAGLFTALKLSPHPVTVISPEPLGEGASSTWAQGGVAAAVGRGDSPAAHAHDTMRAGAGIVDRVVADGVTKEAEARIEDLARMGAPFDRNENGAYVLSREAAHGVARVVRVAGDRAGREIMTALIKAVRETPSITVIEGLIAVDFTVEEGRVNGVICRRAGDRYATPVHFRAPATILAGGGLGGLYAVTTNPPRVRGQAVGMAARAGAKVADAEFVQFHPTAILTGDDPAPLATEALRGEGAVLIDDQNTRFMLEEHPDAELAPRDIVARAIFRRIQAGRKVFLDAREALGARFENAFPTVAATMRGAGLDPNEHAIPVAPAAHYHMGGVSTDGHGRSSLPGLWACGEAGSTGLHGANRLASNGLLEAIVFAARVAQDVGGALPQQTQSSTAARWRLKPVGTGWTEEDRLRKLVAVADLRHTMTRLCGVERDAAGLRKALRRIHLIEREAVGVSRSFINMTAAATLVVASALQRQESRGGHFRTDFPTPSDAWSHRSEITLEDAMRVRNETAETAA